MARLTASLLIAAVLGGAAIVIALPGNAPEIRGAMCPASMGEAAMLACAAEYGPSKAAYESWWLRRLIGLPLLTGLFGVAVLVVDIRSRPLASSISRGLTGAALATAIWAAYLWTQVPRVFDWGR